MGGKRTSVVYRHSSSSESRLWRTCLNWAAGRRSEGLVPVVEQMLLDDSSCVVNHCFDLQLQKWFQYNRLIVSFV